MPSISLHRVEIQRLDSCSDRFRPLAHAAWTAINEACATSSCSPLVVYGTRSAQKQLEIWMEGRTLIANAADLWSPASWRVSEPDKIKTRAFPGQSAHQSGDAVDIALIEGEGIRRHWLDGNDHRWRTIIHAVAKKLGLVWGGEFRGLYDAAHLQHPDWVPTPRR